VAEYQAVIAALEWLSKNYPIIQSSNQLINFYLDSQLIVNQLNGNFKIKNSNLQKLIVRAKNLERKISGEISYSYVSRRKNKIADALVNQALNGL
jgi:ribonuclease HI